MLQYTDQESCIVYIVFVLLSRILDVFEICFELMFFFFFLSVTDIGTNYKVL